MDQTLIKQGFFINMILMTDVETMLNTRVERIILIQNLKFIKLYT